jgi:hypothetical protein
MESHTVSPQQHGVPHKNAQHKAPPMLIKAVIASIIVIVGAAIAIAALAASRSNSPAGDRYQAVFLNSSNSQVFFGKLKNTSGEYLVLENAYYSKASEVPENATAEQKAATSNNVSLVKVGDEVYGPENVLKIRSEQVLFWQDLKSDSKVAKAIDSAK